MAEKTLNLVSELDAVLKKHNAELGYTTDDDGVHVIADGETVAIRTHSKDWFIKD
jgi:hypothetical protein